jgi:two-component system response regulator YesN
MDRRVEHIISRIDVDPSSQMRLSDLARLVNLSPWHLSHIFVRETHVSFASYRKDRRLAFARQLLGTTFLSIKEIMKLVGINDKSHFARDFKKNAGVSPSEYRQIMKNQTHSVGDAPYERASNHLHLPSSVNMQRRNHPKRPLSDA